MANKTFIVQYLIKARDHFSKAAESTRDSTSKLRVEIERSKRAAAALSAQSTTLRDRLRSIVPSMSVLTAKSDQLKAAVEKVEKRFEGLTFVGEKVRNAGLWLSAGITAPVAFMAKAMTDLASDANETRSKFATVFSGLAKQSESVADSFAKNFGLAGSTARELLGDTGDILTGFGFTQKAALDLSKQVNELAVDLASFTNYSGGAKGASEALVKALLGEAESVKALGIVIRQDTPEYKKLVQSIQRTQKVSLVQAKAVAALRISMMQSKNAIGDYARTQEQLANQERATAERIKDLKEKFGIILMPVALKLTKAVRGLVESIIALSPEAKRTILIIGGVAAVVGPLLLLIGGLILAMPMLTAGFAGLGVAVTGLGTVLTSVLSGVGVTVGTAFAPVWLVAAALAGLAYLVITHWGAVKTFFQGFAMAVEDAVGPTATHLYENFKRAAEIIASLFSADSAAAKSLMDFSNIGRLVGDIIGGFLDLTIRGLSGIGAIIGQVIGAITTMDFSQFDIAAIKAEFLGAKAEPMLARTQVDVGVNVGLDQGLAQTSKAVVASTGARRADVGVLTP